VHGLVFKNVTVNGVPVSESADLLAGAE